VLIDSTAFGFGQLSRNGGLGKLATHYADARLIKRDALAVQVSVGLPGNVAAPTINAAHHPHNLAIAISPFGFSGVCPACCLDSTAEKQQFV
jgi:hypothetical protein